MGWKNIFQCFSVHSFAEVLNSSQSSWECFFHFFKTFALSRETFVFQTNLVFGSQNLCVLSRNAAFLCKKNCVFLRNIVFGHWTFVSQRNSQSLSNSLEKFSIRSQNLCIFPRKTDFSQKTFSISQKKLCLLSKPLLFSKKQKILRSSEKLRDQLQHSVFRDTLCTLSKPLSFSREFWRNFPFTDKSFEFPWKTKTSVFSVNTTFTWRS